MNRALLIPLLATGLLATAGAAAHHGWSEYDATRTLNVVGTVQKVGFSNPHVVIDLQTTGPSGRTWEAVLAPPSRMQARGLPANGLRVGMTARVVGYPHKRTEGEMRAERIIIANDTTELR